MPKLDETVYVRLSKEEKEELKREADILKLHMSDIARRRMFTDPVTDITHKIEVILNRSLTQLAFLNAIYSRMEPNKHARRANIGDIKDNILKSEEERRGYDVD